MRAYKSWASARQRCTNPQHPDWANYGGRGIRMCAGYLPSGRGYEAWVADLGQPAPGLSIDRVDNDGHYSCGRCEECLAEDWPFNLRWATPKEQAANQRQRGCRDSVAASGTFSAPPVNDLANHALRKSLTGLEPFRTVLADPPWRFQNRTGKMAPEHARLSRYGTMTLPEIEALPVDGACDERCHLYLWVPNALLAEGMAVMEAWGFTYKTNLVWFKQRKDGGPDGRGVGFYFRNVTELVLFGIRGKDNRTLAPGRRQVNFIGERKREHSRKPDGLYEIVEACSPGPYLELFARAARPGWTQWGNELDDYRPERFSAAPYGVRKPRLATA